MKIRLLSDLHLEGHTFKYEYQGEDVVVLAGDIHTKNRHAFILDQIPENVKILFVCGNHEYYGSCFEEVNDFFYHLQADYPNLYVLQNEDVIIDDVAFYGGTMFTDMMLDNDTWKASLYAQNGIADFTWIDKQRGVDGTNTVKRRWSTDDHRNEHGAYCDGLDRFVKREKVFKRCVISHFVPHRLGSDPRFDGSPLQPYFICDMTRYMETIDLWLYGHTHTSRDFMHGNTRLVCNPRGYGAENASGFNKNLIVEI